MKKPLINTDSLSLKKILTSLLKILSHKDSAPEIDNAPAIDYNRDPNYHLMSAFNVKAIENDRVRINLIIPSVHKDHMTGGPATLLNYIIETNQIFGKYSIRLIPVIVPFTGLSDDLPSKIKNYTLGNLLPTQYTNSEIIEKEIIVDAAYHRGFLTIGKNDVFIATMWSTHYVAKDLQMKQKECFGHAHKIQYVIQDYESSAIYPWSEFFLFAEQTYSDTHNTIAIVGTQFLHEYLKAQGHTYDTSYWFEPGKNAISNRTNGNTKKEEIMVIYGRPDTPRNCFSLLMEALLKLTAEHPSIAERFKFISVGEKHPNYKLRHGATLESYGFMPIEEYRDLLARAAVGCFIVISPHTGYVGLEMARNGILSVSNSFRTKNIQQLHPNIRPVEQLNVNQLTDKLLTTVQEFWRAPDATVSVAIQFEDEEKHKTQIHNEFPFIQELYNTHYNFDNTK